MNITKIYIAIVVGVLTTSLPSATSATTSDQLPATKEKDRLMSQEEMAHKMWLFNQARPKLPSEIGRSHIGPTLHELNGKTFTCPAGEELQHAKSFKKSLRGLSFMAFEINGIHFDAKGLPRAYPHLTGVAIDYEGPEKKVIDIECLYEDAAGAYFTILVNLNEYPLKGSLITFSQKDMKSDDVWEPKAGALISKKNIEFTIQPLPKK